jgi:peptide/nickel transport system substrate-binding protein
VRFHPHSGSPISPPMTSSLNRRRLLALAATGLAVGPVRGADAQENAATPVASPVPAATPVASLTPQRGGALQLVRPGDNLRNLNPAAFAVDYQVTLSYLEPLVMPDSVTMEPRAWLASSWAWRDDGLALELTLRDDVTWHDGTPFSAADAAFSYTVYQADADSAVSGFFTLAESFEATSDQVLTVRFQDRDANWLLNAATLPIFSRAQYIDFWDAQRGARSLTGFDWEADLPIGTGPWEFASLNETEASFARANGYWQQPAWADTLEISVEPGRQARLEAWKSGDAALLWPVSEREARAAGAANVVAAPAASVMFAAFNFANPDLPAGSYWGDLRVRQAASLALNRARYASEVFGDRVDAFAAGVVSQPWAHDADLRSPERDLLAAQSMLADAGWLDYDGDGVREDANGFPLRPVIIVRDDARPELHAVLARVARDLFDAGFGITVESLSPDDFDDRWINSRTYDLIAYAYDQAPGFTDYDLFGSQWDIRSNPAGWNPGGYSNPEADAAIDAFLEAVSLERQRTALQQLQAATNDDLFGLWFGFPRDAILVQPGVNGFQPNINWQTMDTSALWLTTPSGGV